MSVVIFVILVLFPVAMKDFVGSYISIFTSNVFKVRLIHFDMRRCGLLCVVTIFGIMPVAYIGEKVGDNGGIAASLFLYSNNYSSMWC